MAVEREVRFAVVIYGGVSLAVYINGVVQEMLHLVRSTALPRTGLKGSEVVYRSLACRLGIPEGKWDSDDPGSAMELTESEAPEPRTRFIVDILSGTSAGGINAIFLGKALSRGKSLDNLAELWLDVADLTRLLNDRGAAEGPVTYEPPPKSLLSGKWMYLKLMEALDAMEDDAESSPLVEDLDFYSTATDLDGLPAPILLADQSVEELRHKSVFRFRFRDGTKERNDFLLPSNPFLAFAARCTSSFPFAFEPMALCDIFPVIQGLPKHRGQPWAEDNSSYWKGLYPDYERAETAYRNLTPFVYRAFGDGGYLDNKPFSYAIDTITTRHADVPVDRKLIYIEPSPEDIRLKKRKGPDDRPDAIENSLDALTTLPRYETIREDLERVLAWNREVERLKRVLDDLDPDLDKAEPDPLREKAWKRLRLSAATDCMATRATEAVGLDPRSRWAEAMRTIIGVWREKIGEAQEDEIRTCFDFDYYVRAIQYLRRRADKRWRGGGPRSDYGPLSAAKKTLRSCLEQDLPNLRDLLTANPDFGKDLDSVGEAGLSATERRSRVEKLLDQGWRQGIDQAYERLRKHFRDRVDAINASLNEVFEQLGGKTRFQTRDTIVYPILFGTNLGEFSQIDVVRISPEDATPIEGVTDTAEEKKLKGQSFGAFGAFFERDWRMHDMLRGRLDGAERLISAILCDRKDAEEKEKLITAAQEAIAEDWEEFLKLHADTKPDSHS